MPVGAYRRPPITEAVIDIRFESAISAKDLERLRKRLFGAYPHVENRLAWNLALGPGTVKVDHAPAGWKLSAPDALDIVILDPNGITNSRLAPYNTWSRFRDRAHGVMSECMAVIGNRPAKRLGVRYINRIDIPSQHVRVDEWVQLAIMLPRSLPQNLTSYGLSASMPLNDSVRLNLSSSPVESPLLNHSSLLLDIDVFIDHDIPTNYSVVWGLIDRLRDEKNDVFEACITPAARDLFDTDVEG